MAQLGYILFANFAIALLAAIAGVAYGRRHPAKPQLAKLPFASEVDKPLVEEATLFDADIDARAAFFQILDNSEWRKDQDQTTDVGGLVPNWRAVRLSAEIHKALRNSRLAAWGEECLHGTASTPEKPIPAEIWDHASIMFDRSSLPRTAVHLKGYTSREHGKMTWVGVRFSSAQIFKLFPIRQKPSLDRISMVELVQIAVKLGWNFTDQHSLELIDLQDAIRQGGLDGYLTIWGRLNRWPNAKDLMLKEVIEKIPPAHWQQFRILLFPALEGDNFGTLSWHVTPSATAEKPYVDLHVERTEATAWLQRDAVSFKGKTTVRNRT